MLKLFYADVSCLDSTPEQYILSEYRKEKLEQLKPADSRRQGLGAELLLNRAAASCRPGIALPLTITVGEYGKPAWDIQGLYFNLSHSDELAACAVADCAVGVDVQKACAFPEKLAARYFTEEEYKAILAVEDEGYAFGKLWSLKESYLKAIGTGIHMPLNSFSVILENGIPGARFWHSFFGGFHFAVCTLGGCSAVPDIIQEIRLP